LRAQRSNPDDVTVAVRCSDVMQSSGMDCFVAIAPRNDG